VENRFTNEKVKEVGVSPCHDGKEGKKSRQGAANRKRYSGEERGRRERSISLINSCPSKLNVSRLGKMGTPVMMVS